jgi:hypothetical protein
MNQPKPGASRIRQACGHFSEFVLKRNDRYAQDRLAKFMGLKCKACRVKDRLAREQLEAGAAPQAAAEETAGKPVKAEKEEGAKHLPVGTKMEMQRMADGHWEGTIVAMDLTISAVSNGMMGLIKKLEGKWLKKSQEEKTEE